MKVSREEFGGWKNHPVTQMLFNVLEEMKLEYEADMISDGIIFDPLCQIKLAELSGARKSLNDILMLTYEDFNDEGELDVIDESPWE